MFLCFLLVIVLFKMAPKHSTQMLLADITKQKKALICLTEKNICFIAIAEISMEGN